MKNNTVNVISAAEFEQLGTTQVVETVKKTRAHFIYWDKNTGNEVVFYCL